MNDILPQGPIGSFRFVHVFQICLCAALTIILACALRMLEWPCWQNPEYRFEDQMLLATHDAYHWLAGATGFGRAVDHPMALMLKHISDTFHLAPANVAFWFPAYLASLVAGTVFLWSALLGNVQTGIAAGLITSISPGFLGRTLLGYYDTDLVTLFFPLLTALIPAIWCKKYLRLQDNILFSSLYNGAKAIMRHKNHAGGKPLATESSESIWIPILALGGLFSCWTAEWHSLFPYLVRYNAILLTALTLLAAHKGSRTFTLGLSLCHTLSALAGFWGLLWAGSLYLYTSCQHAPLKNSRRILRYLLHPAVLSALLLISLWLVIRGDILASIIRQINAYMKASGDIHNSGSGTLVFPSVAQSIIEVQDLSLAALFPYFHPWFEAAVAGYAGFIVCLFKRPLLLFLLPLAALGLASSQLGGRMVMFGAPIVALGLALPAGFLCRKCLSRWLNCAMTGWIGCLILCALLVAPFADMIPALSQGPIINRRHASVLSHASTVTPQDSLLWVWWDWGYAAQYFARRATIADGAEHGGPSLYLPAAVFATDNPRFARQVIRLTSANDNIPANFFKDMDAQEAQDLIDRLQESQQPLVHGKGRQFIITSFEMLRLGFWISNYGNWNFMTRQGEGGAISILSQALAYNFEDGEVRLEGRRSIIFPISISVFKETGLTSRNYVQEWFQAHPNATVARQKAFMESRRNINFLFNHVTDEKLAMDENIYNSLMVRLLVCDPKDPAITPYFRLIYDNVFARIYEVLPASGDES